MTKFGDVESVLTEQRNFEDRITNEAVEVLVLVCIATDSKLRTRKVYSQHSEKVNA